MGKTRDMNKKQEILSTIKTAAQKVDPSAEVILFGSQARGDERGDSDWDVLILVDTDQINMDYKWQFLNPFLKIELKYGIPISKLILNKHKWKEEYRNYPLHIEVEKEGVLL